MLDGEIDNRDSTGGHLPYVPNGVFVAPERDEDAVVVGGGRQAAKPVVDGQHPVVVFCEPRDAADPQIADRRNHHQDPFSFHVRKDTISPFSRQDGLFHFRIDKTASTSDEQMDIFRLNVRSFCLSLVIKSAIRKDNYSVQSIPALAIVIIS